ncbi:lysostaphin resistance A-like protein [Glutamicibacter sp. NPDC087344]|uniref:CPBP family intramembrane glutamic endopeptidase n=1 Tax=Glutamicibacter sp. NPDC087344 TaxID=3363994 RepID=UPI0037FC3C3D
MASISTGAWKEFWNKGRWWKAFLIAIVYLGLYLGAGWVSGIISPTQVNLDNIFDSPTGVFFGLTFGLLIGAILLSAFVASLSWFGDLFKRQPVKGRWWMWLGPAIPVLAIALRLFGIDYGTYLPSVVMLTLATGLLVGFTEEILTRGIAVKILREAGLGEWSVAVLSSLVFALLHTANLFSGMSLLTVLGTVGYTLAFGMLMYLTLRVTGYLIWPMLIHGLTDPTLMLASGGIDQAGVTQNVFLELAGPANLLTIIGAVVALIFIRGRVFRDTPAVELK